MFKRNRNERNTGSGEKAPASAKRARRLGGAALGEKGRGKYTPDIARLEAESMRLSSAGDNALIRHADRAKNPIAELHDRKLTGIVTAGDTILAVVDQVHPKTLELIGSEVLVLPYGSAESNRSSVILPAERDDQGWSSVVVSRSVLESVGITDVKVSEGGGGHVSIHFDASNGRLMMGDSQSMNGTFLAEAGNTGSEFAELVADINNHPEYLYGGSDGKAATILAQG